MLKENKKSNFKKSVLMGAMLLAPSVFSTGQKVNNLNASITAHADTTGSESFSSSGQNSSAAGAGESRSSTVHVIGSYHAPEGIPVGGGSRQSVAWKKGFSPATTENTNNGVTANQNLNGGAVDANQTGSSTASETVAKPFTTTIKVVNANTGETVNSAVVTYTPNSQGTAYSVSVNNPQLAKYVNNVKVSNTQIENYLQLRLNQMSSTDEGKKVYNNFFFGDDKWQLTPNEQSNADQDAIQNKRTTEVNYD